MYEFTHAIGEMVVGFFMFCVVWWLATGLKNKTGIDQETTVLWLFLGLPVLIAIIAIIGANV